ncbi:MAG: amidohydrolase family protein [Candidatus Latescibacterota bacterium]
MLVIDVHEHVIPRQGFLHPRMKETICTAAELVAIMDREGIDRMVALPLSSPETYHFVQSVEEVFEACDQFPDRFIKFGNADPRLEVNATEPYDFKPILEYYRSLGARGVGEATANLAWDDPRYQNLLRATDELGLPFLFHLATHEFNTYGIVTEPGLGGLERALKQYPRIQFIGHSPGWWSEVGGNPSRADLDGYPKGKVAPGGRVPELLRTYPNIWGDLSAGSGYNALARDPEWAYGFLEEFQDRLMMGLDICIPSNDRCELLGFLRRAHQEKRISPRAFAKIMGENACRLLEL